MWVLINGTKERIYKAETLTDVENKFTVTRGQVAGV